MPQMASVTGDPTLPPDHLWLDLFWMPTVAPNHVSTPFATQGKVNLNFQMMPFAHIRRATALHALFKAERLMAIPTSAGQTYKTSQDNPDWRHVINAEETLKQFDAKFAKNEIFMTESEICEQFLIPEGQVWDENGKSIREFWDAHRLSGDNTLERPYAGLYSRVTTRSNAYRLHMRLQLLDPLSREVTDEHRGSTMIVRELDHLNHEIPVYQNDRSDPTKIPRMERFYRYSARDRKTL